MPEAGISRAAASQPVTATQVLSGVDFAPLTATVASTTTASAPDAVVSVPPPLLTMSADPFQVLPGGVITYSVAITNVAETALQQVVLDNPLPAGVVYVAQSAVGFVYSPRDQRLTWAIDRIAPGHEVHGGFQLRATGLGIGDLIDNTVSASSANAAVVTASAAVEVAPPRQNRVWATPGEGGWLRSEDRRVDLRAPAGAVAQRTELRYAAESGLPLPEHMLYAFRLEASDEAGQPVTQFGRPVTVSAFFDPRQLPSGGLDRLALFHLNEDSGEWELVPSQIDQRWRRVVAQIDQLAAPSRIAEGVTDQSRQRSASDDDAEEAYALGLSADVVETFITERMSSLRGAQTNLFSLSIGYSYPLDLPPGRGGLTPLLAMNYSSANHTPASGHHSVVGFGWELAGADYVYTPPGDEGLGKITLSLQGRTYSLRKGTQGGQDKWYAVEDPFLKIVPGNESHGTYGSWTVWTQDGTKYSFFDEPYSSASFYWRVCQGCTTGKRYVRIPLREIEDTSQNKIHLTWAGEDEAGPMLYPIGMPPTQSPNYTRAIRLTEIKYNGGNTRVVLNYPEDARADLPDGHNTATWRFYTEKRLATIRVEAKDIGTGAYRTVREYRLSHVVGPAANPSARVLNLETIEERDGAENTLPSTSILYSDYFFAAASHFGAMTKISNGYGGEIEFTSDHRNGGDSPHVVSARTEKYGVSDLVNQTWSYVGETWDEIAGTDMARGYKKVRVTRPDGAVEEHLFHGIETVNGNASDHLAGRNKELIVEKPAGTQLARTVISWEASTDRLPVDPAQGAEERIRPRHVRVAYTETFEAGRQLLRTEYGYDPAKQGETQWGNVTRTAEKVWTNGAWSNPYRTSYVWYVPNVAQSITSKPARIDQYEGCGDCGGGIAGSIVSQRVLYYDQNTAGNWQQAPTLGRLRFETIGSGAPGAAPLLKTEYQYWSNGNLRKVIDGLQHATETFYDSQFQAYPVCVKNALGHTAITRYYGVPGSSESGCTTTDGTAAWNSSGVLNSGAFFGQVEDVADANSALTSFSYDSWGRQVGIWRPGDAKVSSHAATEVYSYEKNPSEPFKVKHGQRDDDLGGANAATYLESYTFYDTFGRAVQTQSEAASAGRIIVANTRTNGLDQVVWQSLPYEVIATLGDYQTPNWSQPKTETGYDGLGRVLTVTNPNGSQRQARYRFDAAMANREIGVVDELGHQQIQEIDAFGRLVKAKQYTVTVTGSPPIPNWSAAVYAQATYEYTVANQLKRLVGPDNAETSINYDALGRKTSMSDPDMGVWLYRYDAAGNLRKQRDAQNVMTCFHYDSLNRLVGKSFHPNTPDPDQSPDYCDNVPANDYDVTYGYDSGANGIGRRASATVFDSPGSASNSVSWLYDGRGRVAKETVSVTPPGFTSALSYVTDISYDAADRVRTMTYPADIGAREVVTTTYNAQGLPYSLTSSTGATYVSSTTYDALGRLDQQMLGNALMVDREYWGWSEAEGGGRLKRIFLLKSPYNSGVQANKLQDLMYRYDAAGNVTSIQDTINRSGALFQRECFSYDALNRLTRGFTTGATACNNNPGALGSGVYDQSYGYASNGNLANKTGVGSYTYNAPSPQGCATGTRTTKPHAVKIAGGATYTYDCNGNMTGRTRSGVTVALSYDEENRLASVTDPAQPSYRQTMFFEYNADGQRVVKTDTYNGTLFVGNHMEANWATGPLASPLGSFEAMPQGEDILVAWLTLFETDLLGFNLYRSTDTQAPDQQLNGAMILAQYPGSSTGASYTWLDEEVEQGKPYYYWLELLTPSGSQWAGPIEVGEGRLADSQSPQVTTPSSFRRYYYLGGQRIAMRYIAGSDQTLVYLHSDHLGSHRLGTGVVGQVWDPPVGYYPFGELRYGSPWNNSYRFTGQRFDYETDLYYYGARFYDGALGRFISPDTIVPEPGNPQALNRYSYVTNRPTIAIDPTGHDLMIVGGAGGDLDIAIWQQWIVEYKGWSLEQWNKFHATWNAAQDLDAKNEVLAAEGIGVFNWGGTTWDEAKTNAHSETTISMVDELASQMAGMKDVTLLGWSKGGNLVLQYLWAQEQGRLKDAVIPVRAVLLAPGTHPAGPILGASWVRNEVPGGWPATVNICSHGDRACPLTIRNAVWNINPPWNGNFHGPHGRFAASVIDALNVAGHHQARPRLPR